MVRFIALLILFLALGSVRSDESQELRKVNRHKFLLDLLKRLRKLRNHKKSGHSQAIYLNQLNEQKKRNQPSASEPQISQNQNVTNKRVITYEKKSQERSNVIKPAKARESIGRHWKNLNQLLKTSKTEVLLDLLKTLKRIRNHVGVGKTFHLPNSPVIPQRSLLQNVSTFIASHSQSEDDFPDVSTKFEQRASVIKPVERLVKISENQESKARYSYALARMSFLEQLEKAQEEKLNKLSKLEKEFSGILPESARHDVAVKPTSAYFLQNDLKAKEEIGIPSDKIQKPAESTKKEKGEGKILGSFTNLLSNKLKNRRPQRVIAHFVHGEKKKSLRRDHMITPWSQVRSRLSGSPERFSNGSIQNVRTFQSSYKALINEYRAATKGKGKSNILASLRRLKQKILLDFNRKKTTSKASHNKNEVNRRLEFSNGFGADKYMVYDRVGTPQYQTNDVLRQTLHNNQNTPNAEFQTNESKNTNGQVQSHNNHMPKTLNINPDNSVILPANSSKNKVSNQAVTTQLKTNGNLPEENSLFGENIGNGNGGIKVNQRRQFSITQGLKSSTNLAPGAALSKPPGFAAPQHTDTHKIGNQMVTPNKFYKDKNQEIAAAKYSDKYTVYGSVGKPQYQTNDIDLGQTSHNNQNTPNAEYQKNESTNTYGQVPSHNNRMPKTLNKNADNSVMLPSYWSKHKHSNQAATTQFKTNGKLPQKNSLFGENIGNIKGRIKENQGRQSPFTIGLQSSITLEPVAAQINPPGVAAPQHTNTHKIDNQRARPRPNTISSKANQNVYGKNRKNQQQQYSLSSLKLPTQTKQPYFASASHSSQNKLGKGATPQIEHLHKKSMNTNQVDNVKSSSFSNIYELGNDTTTTHPKIDGSSVQHSLDDKTGISGVYGRKNEQNNGNHQLESSTAAILGNQNKSPGNLASPFNSNELRLGGNQTSNLESKTDAFPQNSPIHKNKTSEVKLTAALQKAQGIFLEKVKDILAGHHKSNAVQNINFGDSKNQDNGKHDPDENVIKSSAYIMDESPATKPVPKKETNENSGIVPQTPPNPVGPLPVGNIASPPMQLPNLGFDAPRQAMGQLNSDFSSPVQSPGAVTPLNYAEQEQANEEERIASKQERDFRNMKNGASSFNGENVPYEPSQSTGGLNQINPEMRYPLPNADFRPPDVDDLDEYRGGMERYQLSHKLGLGYGVDDLGDRRKTHLHRYSHDDEDNDEDDDEDDGDDDEFDDGKKKSHIRKPMTSGKKYHRKGLTLNHKQKPTLMREMKHPSPSTKSYLKKKALKAHMN